MLAAHTPLPLGEVFIARRCPALQAGDFAAAQPLYERALEIWEAVLGPEHPDVAHTLTDLAVLHLEQVRVYTLVEAHVICSILNA